MSRRAAAERLDEKAAFVDLPRAGHEAVDEKRLRDVAVRCDHTLAVRVRQDAAPLGRRIREQRRVPLRKQARRRRRAAVRSRGALKVVEEAATLVAEPPRRDVGEHRADRGRRHAKPGGDVVHRCRAECREVTRGGMRHRQCRQLRIADPLVVGPVGGSLRQPVAPRRRQVHEPRVHEGDRPQRPDLARLDRAVGEADRNLPPLVPGSLLLRGGAQPLGHGIEVDGELSLDPWSPCGDDRRRVNRVIGARDEMERRAHQRRLDDRPPGERSLELCDPRTRRDATRARHRVQETTGPEAPRVARWPSERRAGAARGAVGARGAPDSARAG